MIFFGRAEPEIVTQSDALNGLITASLVDIGR